MFNPDPYLGLTANPQAGSRLTYKHPYIHECKHIQMIHLRESAGTPNTAEKKKHKIKASVRQNKMKRGVRDGRR